MRSLRRGYAQYKNGDGKGGCGPLDSGHAQSQDNSERSWSTMQEIVPRNKIVRACRPRRRATPRLLTGPHRLGVSIRVYVYITRSARACPARFTVMAQVAGGLKVTCGG
ncbi:hypothetical protein EVAR_39304_1 [Eumeta japonica]|uniref:Uncharacterized protein n=1 Tax=Eumeta variegata TaxID=151549 RepID=A0A4C1VVI6_EUMVA|nr:hypothetical protein EVAR_39304_1 [Eumeta japonica]